MDAQLLERLTNVLERAWTAPGAPAQGPARDQFKTPQYNGQGDVDYFISQFQMGGSLQQPGFTCVKPSRKRPETVESQKHWMASSTH